MTAQPQFNADLVCRYGGPAPRYTSYPTAAQFHDRFGEAELRAAAIGVHNRAEPLSLYVHIPFCASPCFYCGCNRVITRSMTMADDYLARLEREIALQGELFRRPSGVGQLHFGGGTPTFLTTDRLARVVDALDRNFGLGDAEGREYSIEVDPRTVSPETMQDLAGLGFNRVSFGVQDFDPRVQQAVNRVQGIKDTLDLIESARGAGFHSVSVDLIYGLPLQTPLSFGRTLDLVLAAQPDRVAAYSYAHLPHLFPGQRQIRLADVPSADTRLALMKLTVERMTAAGYVYIGMDHFARPQDELARALGEGGLQRNFQGYSTHGGTDLVGLGISAISRIGDSYSQNVKTLPEYEQLIDQGRLPVSRGVTLTRDDRLRRDIIEALMCHGRVAKAAMEDRYGIHFDEYFAREMRELRAMAVDGLVRLDADWIEVEPAGRLLLRAVAKVFDAYAAEPPAAEKPRFSRVV
ncbi:MAG: oxygen-independent coproporphyrinogen III oxidase [Gammaproteobacteria bacterium]|nr:oxygen-independent coproporphyrinogen III oxidase [Gammaproteobacteria bacterium]